MRITFLVVWFVADLFKTRLILSNNWIPFYENDTVTLYPRLTENRRYERRKDVSIKLEDEGFKLDNILNYRGAKF